MFLSHELTILHLVIPRHKPLQNVHISKPYSLILKSKNILSENVVAVEEYLIKKLQLLFINVWILIHINHKHTKKAVVVKQYLSSKNCGSYIIRKNKQKKKGQKQKNQKTG